MEFLLYNGRHGEEILMEKNLDNWHYLVSQLEEHDRMTLDESREQGFDDDGGTYEEGHVSCDDGGEIHTIRLYRKA